MIRFHPQELGEFLRIPRESGDDPWAEEQGLAAFEYSPRERG